MASVVIRAISATSLPRIAASNFRSNQNILWKNKGIHGLWSRSFVSSNVCRSGRKYSEKHEWVEVDGNIGTVGITNYAQESLGDIVYAQLPEIGTEFSQMDECGALESVKAASELFSPVSGKITDVNVELENQPSLINQSCYDQGWLFKLELSIPDEVSELMEEAEYEKFLKEQ